MSEERGRRRRKRREIEQAVRDYRASGLGPSEFCRQQGFPLSTLQRYLKLQATASPQNTRLIEVEVAPTPRAPEATARRNLALVLKSGHRIEVGEDFEARTLNRLITALEG